MKGPAAPKDPEKRRPFFYIMREKTIFGAKQKDGKGIQFLYQSDGRLISSAQIVGNIADEVMLDLLKTVEGFRKLVHSVGISVETKNAKEEVEFIFQMYGKTDLYGGGTNLIKKMPGDGSEQRIYLSEVEWAEDDGVPGQIKIIMEEAEQNAVISVRLYLNDGFSAPEITTEEAVDFLSEEYRNMIQKSLMSTGNIARIARTIDKAKEGKPVTLAYIGGSITQGAGATPINTECYAYRSYRAFEKKFASSEDVTFVKAGVGGTPSELGMIRFDRDVLRDGETPDVVVIEYAVNDEGDETKGDCYESLVRKVLSLPNKPAVILLFSVFANDDNLQDRLTPVGLHYDLPMVSIKNAVTPQFYMKKGEGKVLSKNQFFYDMFHPSNDGHTIMADCLMHLYDVIDEKMKTESYSDQTEQLLEQPPVIGNTFDHVKLFDKKDAYELAEIHCGGFTQVDQVLQCVEMDVNLEGTNEFPYNWMFDGKKSDQPFFEMKITCKALVLVFKDSGEIDAAKADIYVDGIKVRTADPLVNGWVHCNPIIIINEAESLEHMVRIQIVEGDEEKKFTILGFGYVE